MSRKDKLLRKKYMGLRRRGSKMMVRMVSRFSQIPGQIQSEEETKEQPLLLGLLGEVKEDEFGDWV